MSHIFLRNQMYQQLNCNEILDSLTYYKQVSRLGNLHGDLHSHLHGSIIKLAYTHLCTNLYTLISTGCQLSAFMSSS